MFMEMDYICINMKFELQNHKYTFETSSICLQIWIRSSSFAFSLAKKYCFE